MYRKTLGKQTTYRSLGWTEKQIDYILIKRQHMKYSRDAEANDMIHMGSGHRCVMATFVNTTRKRMALVAQKLTGLEKTKQNIREQADRKSVKKNPYLRKDTMRSGRKLKQQTRNRTIAKQKPLRRQKSQQHNQR